MNTLESVVPRFEIPVLPLAPRINAEIEDFEWQLAAADTIVAKYQEGKRGVVLRGATGYGKMYITCDALSKAYSAGLLKCPEGSFNPMPILWLTPKSVKAQTQRVIKFYGLSHLVMVWSYGQIKSSDGTGVFIRYETELVNGQPIIKAVWDESMLPAIVVCDECHKLKNRDSLQSRVIRALPPTVKTLLATATPIQRVVDGAYTVELCSAITKYNLLPATQATCMTILRDIAEPKNIYEYSPSACGRFRDALEDYFVELKTVRFKHNTRTVCNEIQFRSDEQRVQYQDAYAEYLRELRKRGIEKNHGNMAFIVAMRKFQEKAELLRGDDIAERALANVKAGKQVIIASNYLNTLRKVWSILVHKLNVDKERISFIVGGQTEKLRQEMVDKFQRGDADIVLFTMTCGGVGISLHHDRDTTRPRHIILPPTWSAIDLVQALGRGHRLTSKSPTTQEILWFAGTVESDRVKPKVERKVKCLSKAIIAREQFMTIFEKETEDDIDPELNDEYNNAIAETDGAALADGKVDMDTTEEAFTGEGLDSDDTIKLPTTY